MLKISVVILLLVLIVETAFARNPFQVQTEGGSILNAKIVTLHYASVADVAKEIRLKSNHLLSQEGSVVADVRTNQLLLYDDALHLKRIMNWLKKIDVKLRQVVIEARIVSAENSFLKELGVILSSSVEKSREPLFNSGIGQIKFALANLKDGHLLDAALTALEQKGNGTVIASPHLVTENQKPAYIADGEDIPYQEKTLSGGTNIAFKKAVLGLKITPKITANHRILLTIKITQNKPSNRLVRGVPEVQTQELATEVLVKDKQTLVLGGVYESVKRRQVGRVPILGKIPLFGALFKRTQTSWQRKQLLVFITPHIMQD